MVECHCAVDLLGAHLALGLAWAIVGAGVICRCLCLLLAVEDDFDGGIGKARTPECDKNPEEKDHQDEQQAGNDEEEAGDNRHKNHGSRN